MITKSENKSLLDFNFNTRRLYLGISLVLAICIYYNSHTWISYKPTTQVRSILKQKLQQIQSGESEVNVITKENISNQMVYNQSIAISPEMGWTPYMDIIDEEDALKEPPLTDIKKGVDVGYSRVYIKEKRSYYTVGDTVRVRIDLHDGYGAPRITGGDQLRVRIYEDSLDASACGYVVDHNNGSYTAIVTCLWSGTPTIRVYMAYTRESVRAIYYTRKKLLSLRPVLAVYSNGEEPYCHAFTHKLGKPSSLCNMTSSNGDMSFYCRKPKHAECSDFETYKLDRPVPPPQPITDAEDKLLDRNMEPLHPTFNITVRGSRTTFNEENVKPPCLYYNWTKLWFQASPTGHFIRNKWKPVHCIEPHEEIFESCLRNKHIILYGDSTSRQWFRSIFKRYYLTTEQWTEEKWKKDSKAICERNNLTLEWALHSFPGNMHKKLKRGSSIAEHMMKNVHNKRAIFVIHLLCHVTAYHHSVFRDRISHIRKSVEFVLKENKNAMILIKGGHTFRDSREETDYYTYIYRTILIEEFKGPLDKVVYLDNKDVTVAQDNQDIHPNDYGVTAMVNQMLSYVCGP